MATEIAATQGTPIRIKGWRPKWSSRAIVAIQLVWLAKLMAPPRFHPWLTVHKWSICAGYVVLLLVLAAVGFWEQKRWDAAQQQ